MDIDAYESAQAEALLRAAQTRRRRRIPLGHEILTHALAVGGFLVGAVGLAVLAPWDRSLSVPTLAMLTAIYVVAASVRFPVGSVWANPTQLAFVPMLFLLPIPLVPAVVGAAPRPDPDSGPRPPADHLPAAGRRPRRLLVLARTGGRPRRRWVARLRLVALAALRGGVRRAGRRRRRPDALATVVGRADPPRDSCRRWSGPRDRRARSRPSAC